MSNVKLQASASGTGTVTIAPPVTNSDLTINLPANSGTVPTIASVVNNGVVYTNSTGAITSSSALTFDGTNYLNVTGLRIGGSDTTNTIYQATGALALSTGSTSSIIFNVNLSEGMRLTTTGLGIGTSSPVGKLDVRGASYVDTDYGYFRANNALQRLRIGTDGSNDIYLPGAAPLTISGQAGVAFSTALTERMRLDSSGNLGIGTSSPGQKLDVVGTIQSQNNAAVNDATVGAYNFLNSNSNAASNPIRASIVAGRENSAWGAYLDFYTSTGTSAQTAKMRLDTAGNLGLGVTPSANTIAKAFELQNGFNLFSAFNIGYINANAYFDGNWKYKNTAASGRYEVADSHKWYTAPSGTAGNAITFTQAMTLDASGRLGIGTTSPSVRLDLGSTGNNSFFTATNGIDANFSLVFSSNTATLQNTGGSGVMAFNTNSAERARITSGGKLLLNTTSTVVSGDEIFGAIGTSGIGVKCTGGSGSFAAGLWNNATSGNNVFVYFYTETAGDQRGSITYNRGGGVVAYNTTSDYRAKDILGPVQNAGATIDGLKVYMGKMKGATIERPMMIAHEAQEVTPYAVTGEKDAVNDKGEPIYQAMDHQVLVPLLIAEIQSLRARVAALESNP